MQNSHKTTITSTSLSLPIRHLVKHRLLKGKVLDYGCGKGYDADQLAMHKYDPHFYNTEPSRLYDTIVCTYVLNAVSKDDELAILNKIKSLLTPKGKAYISVRRDKLTEGANSKANYQRMSYPNEKSLLHRLGSFEMYVIERLG